jgi:hypothetical protein
MRKRKSRYEHTLLHTVEEATELLRRVDTSAWVWWFGGTVPFVCYLLHFVSDMSRAASAWDRLPAGSLSLGLLYWWMKVAHAVFSDHLLRELRGEDRSEKLNLRARLRFITSQAVIHCTAFVMLPLSLAAMLPFGWIYAAYHNVSVLALSHFRKSGRTRELLRLAVTQSHYRQGANHGLMLVLLTFACIVWLNFFTGALLAVQLAKAITGVDSAFSRNPMLLLSTGVFTTTIMGSYLVVGPLVKAIYVLRCFYSLSRKNGEDLIVAFRSAKPVLALLLAVGLITMPAAAFAAPSTPAAVESPATPVNADKLDQNIRDVLQREAFQWRLPRNERPDPKAEPGWIAGFIKTLGQWVDDAGKWVGKTFDKLLVEKIKELMRDMMNNRKTAEPSGATSAWADSAQFVLKALLIVLALIIVVLLVRFWRRTPPAPAKTSSDAMPEVNLDSEQVIASQLPENEWLRLAQEKMESGDYRLAMRALFLATLAHLGERKIVLIRKSKSNGDYVRELALRARDREDMRNRFTDSVRTFDWAWYGLHDVTRELLDQFRDNHQHIVSDGGAR